MRKTVLSHLVLLAAIYTLSRCADRAQNHAAHPVSPTRSQSAQIAAPGSGNVTFMVRGIVLGQTADGLVAFSPWDQDHTGVFGDRDTAPIPAQAGPCIVTIVLDVQGLKSPAAATDISDAFDPVHFHGIRWQIRESSTYFVIVRFNAQALSIQPAKYDPKEWGSMKFGNEQNKPVMVPESAIVTFDSVDPNKINVKRTVVRTCGNPKDNSRTETNEKLANDRYFVGIGLPSDFTGDKEGHAKGHFNNKILCEIYGSCDVVPQDRKVSSTKSMSSRQRQAPRLTYAAYSNASLIMLAVENCSVPIAVVTPK